jgi:hypothetical protein
MRSCGEIPRLIPHVDYVGAGSRVITVTIEPLWALSEEDREQILQIWRIAKMKNHLRKPINDDTFLEIRSELSAMILEYQQANLLCWSSSLERWVITH